MIPFEIPILSVYSHRSFFGLLRFCKTKNFIRGGGKRSRNHRGSEWGKAGRIGGNSRVKDIFSVRGGVLGAFFLFNFYVFSSLVLAKGQGSGQAFLLAGVGSMALA